jgi:hypothetical protein
MKRWIALLVAAGLIAAGSAHAGNLEVQKVTLFGGSDTDSTEQVSNWFPVRGAKRVIIRLWSGKAAFHASTDADSTFSDSIAVFKVGFTDSIGHAVSTGPAAGDSVVITTATVANIDTTTKMIGVWHPPLQEALRGPANGSGLITWVLPVTPGLATADNDGFIAPLYMRVYLTPLRRMTVTGGQSTAGKRVNGLKKLRGQALVIFDTK